QRQRCYRQQREAETAVAAHDGGAEDAGDAVGDEDPGIHRSSIAVAGGGAKRQSGGLAWARREVPGRGPARPLAWPEGQQEAGMSVVGDQIVPAGKPWSAVIERGQRLRIVDLEGNQGVDFLCYSADNPEERYHAANTLKKSQTLLLTTGHTLYSDVARPL